MKRKLTPREWMLLIVLAILVVGAAYVLLFRTPVIAARDDAIAEADSCREQTQALQDRMLEKQRMERELDKIFAENDNPLALPDYDNLQPVMRELNTVLTAAKNYSLSFANVDDSKNIVRREISVSFACDSYNAAKNVLQRLDDSPYRCMLNNVSVSMGQRDNEQVSVNASIVYFECKE